MKGEWIGIYTYSDGHRAGQEVRFKISIHEFDGENFTGSVSDDLRTGGTKGEGAIQGTLRKGELRFTKQMPLLTVSVKGGNTKEYPAKHPPIYYQGTQSRENHFEGQWKIKRRLILNRFAIGLGKGTSGNWRMEREESFEC